MTPNLLQEASRGIESAFQRPYRCQPQALNQRPRRQWLITQAWWRGLPQARLITLPTSFFSESMLACRQRTKYIAISSLTMNLSYTAAVPLYATSSRGAATTCNKDEDDNRRRRRGRRQGRQPTRSTIHDGGNALTLDLHKPVHTTRIQAM